MKKKYFAVAILLSFFASLALIACSFDAQQPTHAPVMGALQAIQFAGDLDGSYVSQTVVGLEGKTLPSPATGALQYDGGALYWAPISTVGHGTAGQVLATNDAGAATTWVYPHGDVDASATDPGAITVNAIQGYGVSSSTPSTGNALAYSSGLWRPTALSTSNITSGTAGQVMVTNSSPASAWTSLISYETTHGRFTSGGSGSDFSAAMGPIPGDETLGAGLWALPNATAASASNYVFQSDGTNAYYNTIGGSGFHQWRQANGGAIAQLTSSLLYLGGNTTAAPIGLIYSTATTPIIQAGTSATSFTIGTTKSGATLALQSGASISTTDGTTTRDTFELAHGRLTAGGGGSDYLATIGPVVGNETADAAILLAANGVSGNNSNFAVEYGALCDALSGHPHSICLNGPGSNGSYGDITFTNANGNANSLERLGYFDGVSGTLHVTYGLAVMGNNGITWPSASGAVSINSDNATSLTVVSGIAGAFLQLGGDAAANVAKLTTAFEHQTYADFDAVSAPGSPGSTQRRMYVDSADNKLKVKDNLGNITVLTP